MSLTNESPSFTTVDSQIRQSSLGICTLQRDAADSCTVMIELRAQRRPYLLRLTPNSLSQVALPVVIKEMNRVNFRLEVEIKITVI